MLFSIIVPVYNKGEKVCRCLESLRKLRADDVEFVIVNDGSIDDTRSVCERFQKLDSRFRIITKHNSGVSGARNTGIECSRGKYLSFVDADDELLGSYEKVFDCLRREDHELCGFDYCTQKGSSVEVYRKPLLQPGKNERKILYNSFLTGMMNSVCMNIYRSDIIREHKICFTDGMTMGEDCEFNSLYLRHCSEMYYVDEVCYRYYIDDDDSATHQKKLSYLKDFDRIYQAYETISTLEENLEFQFAYEFYLNFVYGILKQNAGSMTRKQKHEFRHSLIYHVLMTRHYENRRMNLKKWFIRCNLYRFI